MAPWEVADDDQVLRPGRLSATGRGDDRAQTTPAGKVGRNQPCPCGSGKKYKKCCLGRERAASAAARAPATAHELDQRLCEQMMRFAGRRLEQGCFERAAGDFVDPEQSLQLLVPWAVHQLQEEFHEVELFRWSDGASRRLAESTSDIQLGKNVRSP